VGLADVDRLPAVTAEQVNGTLGVSGMYRTIIATTVLVGVCTQALLAQEKKPDAVRVLIVPTEQPVAELHLLGIIADPNYSFDDILKHAERLRSNTTDEEGKKVLSSYIATLKTMARREKERIGEKNEIKRLIYSLRNQEDFAFFTTDDPKSPAGRLLSLGKKAIPYLIDELENDELTRSVSPGVTTKQVIPRMHVLRIGDCVCGILREITGQSFGDSWYIHGHKAQMSPRAVREQAKKWWKKQK
jgi:hypothetical protein